MAAVAAVSADVHSNGGDHRNVPRRQNSLHRRRVHGGNLANIAQLGAGNARLKQTAIHPADANRRGAQVLHLRGQLLINQPAENGNHDFQRWRIRNPQAVDKAGRQVLPAHPVADDIPAAVYDNHRMAGGVPARQVMQGSIVAPQRAAANFDHNRRFR